MLSLPSAIVTQTYRDLPSYGRPYGPRVSRVTETLPLALIDYAALSNYGVLRTDSLSRREDLTLSYTTIINKSTQYILAMYARRTLRRLAGSRVTAQEAE